MARIHVGVGSNFERERNIREALALLEARFGPLDVSPVYASTSVDGDGPEYFNLVVAFDCSETVETVFAALKSVETAIGRERGPAARGACAIDLDLLLYADLIIRTESFVVPRADILRYPFVLQPLAQLAPDARHPETGETYHELWTAMRRSAASLREVGGLLNDPACRRASDSAP